MNPDVLSPALKSRFTRWRWSVYTSMFVGCSFHMLVRMTLPSTMPSLIQHQGLSREDVGMMASCFATSYGVSKFMASIISDHASSRKVFSCGLILSGLLCSLFPMASRVALLGCVVWLLEGVVQGLGWPPCVVLLRSWYPPSQIGRWWSALCCGGNIVTALLPLIVIFLTSIFHWPVCYYLFGFLSFGMGVLVLFTIKDSPADIGLGSIHQEPPSKSSSYEEEKDHGNVNSHHPKDRKTQNCRHGTKPAGQCKVNSETRECLDEKNKSTSKRSWYLVFIIPNLWAIGGVYIILALVSSCVQNWSQLYFVQEVGMVETSAAACYSMFQVGGLVGSFVSGFISDLLITPRTLKTPCPRAPFLMGVAILLMVLIHLLRTTIVAGAPQLWVSSVMFMLGVSAYSGVAVAGLSAMDMVEPHMAASAHGLACAIGQAGCFAAGWPFSHILETHNWNTAYLIVELTLVVLVVLCTYFVLLLIKHLVKQKTD